MKWSFEVPDDLRLVGIAEHRTTPGDGFFAYVGQRGGSYLQGRWGLTQQEAIDNAVAAVRLGLKLPGADEPLDYDGY